MDVKLVATRDNPPFRKIGDKFSKPAAVAKLMVHCKLAAYETPPDDLPKEPEEEPAEEPVEPVVKKRRYKRRDLDAES